MSPPFQDLQHHFLVGQQMAAGSVSGISPYPLWHLCDHIAAYLLVNSSGAAPTDTLNIVIDSSPDRVHWTNLFSFTEVDGNDADDYYEAKLIERDPIVSPAWFPYMRATATVVGGTAAFTIGKVVLIGS